MNELFMASESLSTMLFTATDNIGFTHCLSVQFQGTVSSLSVTYHVVLWTGELQPLLGRVP